MNYDLIRQCVQCMHVIEDERTGQTVYLCGVRKNINVKDIKETQCELMEKAND